MTKEMSRVLTKATVWAENSRDNHLPDPGGTISSGRTSRSENVGAGFERAPTVLLTGLPLLGNFFREVNLNE